MAPPGKRIPHRDELGAAEGYRFALVRDWADHPVILWVMLNPNTADARIDDPTIRRCIAFSRDWGFGALRVVNLYPFRASRPRDLWTRLESQRRSAHEWIRRNDDVIVGLAQTADKIVCAWGASGERDGRGNAVRELLRDFELCAPGFTSNGQPAHPLYLPRSRRLVHW
jgi:hypothetical protein